MFTNRFSATRCMKVKKMRVTEILSRIWLFSANKIKSSEPVSKKLIQLIVKLNTSLWQKLGTRLFCKDIYGRATKKVIEIIFGIGTFISKNLSNIYHSIGYGVDSLLLAVRSSTCRYTGFFWLWSHMI